MVFLSAAVLHASCKQKREARLVEPAFYYWKSVFKLNNFEQQRLDSLKVRTLYVKFFDVDWDEQSQQAKPVAKLQTSNYKLPGGIQIIPTVFITNTCIQKIDSGDIKELANKITDLVNAINSIHSFSSPTEIQIDCDWTALTKEKYFALLSTVKQLSEVKISATIRLHQVKYITRSGIPPVDRGLLMCYNMGNLKNPATANSIIETKELIKYTGNLSTYPLPLDIALPIFDWKVLYRDNLYAGLIQNLTVASFNNSFSKKTGNRYFILKDTLILGYDLRKGDMIRDEQSDIKEILSAAGEISKLLENTPLRVSLYHLDSVILNKYTTHELESIYNRMH